jgi:DUF971 family protein
MSMRLQQAVVIGGELAVVFTDGREAFLPLDLLRRACPCAACQGEPDALGRVVRPRVEHGPMAFVLRSIQEIGGYALQLFWADGHSSGIYSFEYLLRLRELPPAP